MFTKVAEITIKEGYKPFKKQLYCAKSRIIGARANDQCFVE